MPEDIKQTQGQRLKELCQKWQLLAAMATLNHPILMTAIVAFLAGMIAAGVATVRISLVNTGAIPKSTPMATRNIWLVGTMMMSLLTTSILVVIFNTSRCQTNRLPIIVRRTIVCYLTVSILVIAPFACPIEAIQLAVMLASFFGVLCVRYQLTAVSDPVA